jgi:hypothetical protein
MENKRQSQERPSREEPGKPKKTLKSTRRDPTLGSQKADTAGTVPFKDLVPPLRAPTCHIRVQSLHEPSTISPWNHTDAATGPKIRPLRPLSSNRKEPSATSPRGANRQNAQEKKMKTKKYQANLDIDFSL